MNVRFPSLKTNRAGFTLIELLIVMVIIAVLATLGFVSYQNALKNTRNSKAIGDMKAVQAAMEQAYTKNNGSYVTSGTTCDTASLESALVAPNGVAYTGPICTSTTYCACAQLVSGSNTNLGNRSAGATSADCGTLTTTGTYFCVKNRQ